LAVEVSAETLNNSTAGSAHVIFAASNGLNAGGGGSEVNQQWLPINVQSPEAFLATNKTKPGVITLTDGLQYKVTKQGTGGLGSVSSQYTVNYIGMHSDGTVFDSSAQHGGPATFGLNNLIPGFSEALSLMRVGDHWTVYLPSNLAYGPGGNPQAGINANEVLIFDLEIVSISSS
jgi:FKBP-type peptidyl-prolyl cis-trans isomerase FklB